MNNDNAIMDQIYQQYFNSSPQQSSSDNTDNIKVKISNYNYNNEHPKQVLLEESHHDWSGMADNNIDDIERLADIIKKLCNAAWGHDWGQFGITLQKGENSSNITLPQITIDTNGRDITEGMSLKPHLMDIIKEKDGAGNETGDAFLLYRQWFTYNIEFNIYGRDSHEARKLMYKLEKLLMVYSGYLKRNGVAEIFFLHEAPPKSSLNYVDNVPMRSIYYYVRIESVIPVRQTVINTINTELGANQVITERVKMLLENQGGSIEAVELDFFEGDNGITLKN